VPQTLALVHTSPTLIPLFSDLCAQQMPAVKLFHMVDESLIKETVRAGHLEKRTIRRLVGMIESASSAGAQAVMVTCSSIGEGVTLAQQLFDFPVIRIDDAMTETAVRSGNKIGVIATLKTTLAPTAALLASKAKALGKSIDLVECLCDGAFEAVLSGDTATHDRIVGSSLVEVMSAVDTIVLAQASMARVVKAMPSGLIQVPVLSSPELCVQYTRDILQKIPGADA
jgi:Asp/Glu/hydantoin racemase